VLGGVGLFLTSIVPGASRRLQNPAVGWIVVEVLLELVACASYAVLFLGMFSRAPYTVPRVRGGADRCR
jgi:hypothetical protein